MHTYQNLHSVCLHSVLPSWYYCKRLVWCTNNSPAFPELTQCLVYPMMPVSGSVASETLCNCVLNQEQIVVFYIILYLFYICCYFLFSLLSYLCNMTQGHFVIIITVFLTQVHIVKILGTF